MIDEFRFARSRQRTERNGECYITDLECSLQRQKANYIRKMKCFSKKM
ncbi:hypothetical protein LEP1GSC103_0496 [Leptospira borgpetersenii serovar Javanica str. UI 09931]|uniref:Uncharacterized protein n=1 Tax=Leptospira borgpetersenii serovar Javanica str. UI 09931 TaxID=1049767 RepID=A0AAV3JCZ4_LEPBO|nr:hypothetical protein LEP1GSC090_3639 [Leptospira borgpetersenii serovar Javanica str. MK146]EPG58597.1 hypothetical protein LEP1GSC103_0496 [Leptospira borgpetersenii serovar Javanica str. UI 09931]